MRILLTGFEPFLTHADNPTASLARNLDGAEAGDAVLHGVTLPVAFDRAADAFVEAFERVRPDAVLLFGLAYSYDEVRLERVALNLDDAAGPDNDGVVRRNRAIAADGPMAYWSSLPVDLILDRLNEAGLAAKPSRDAGGYVCNHLFFRVRHWLEQRGSSIPAGFVHVPPTPDLLTEADRGRRTGWPQERIERAAMLVAETVARTVADGGRSA